MEVLFSKGSSLTAYPVKVMFCETPVDLIFPAQVMFVAPKRSFKRAHDRNKLKRRMREAYRLNKNDLYDKLKVNEKKALVAFIYVGKKEEDFSFIQKSMVKLISGILTPKEK